jgi:hypothetical protein
VAAESHLAAQTTFKLTYSSYDVPGSPSQIVVEQMPPDKLFDAHTSEVIVKGKDSYYCTVLPAASCEVTHSANASPLAALMKVYTPDNYVATMNTLRKLIKSGVVYDFSSSSKSFAGQASDCASWSYAYSVVDYCVTKTGVLANFTISGVSSSRTSSILTLSIKLISYSTKVTPADFAFPKGVALPKGAKLS